MATPTFGSPLKKVYGEQASLTTTASHLLFRPNYHEVMCYCASRWRMGIAPRLANVQKWSATALIANYTAEATNRDDATHVALDAMGTTDILYLGFTDKVRGFYINVDDTNFNDNAAAAVVEYCSAISAGVGTFTSVASGTDGTDTAGDTLKQDGLYSFTLPAVVRGAITALDNTPLYWYRFKTTGTLSATVDLIDIIPACDTVNYAYMEAGTSYQFSLNVAQNGAFEFDHTSSDTLDVSWIQH